MASQPPAGFGGEGQPSAVGTSTETLITENFPIIPEISPSEQATYIRDLERLMEDEERWLKYSIGWKKKKDQNTSEFNEWFKTAFVDFEFPDPREVLLHLLDKTEQLHSDRYGYFLKSKPRDELICTMESLLRPEALHVMYQRRYSREDLLSIAGKPGARGIYLHVLWLKHSPDCFHQYLGQSIELPDRIDNHQDPYYRLRHPSLHYYVWDLRDINEDWEIEEEFVYLADITEDIDALLLNLLEMWCCLVFQTLTKHALDMYLPKGTVSPFAGTHLNVQIPLHQSSQGSALPSKLVRNSYRTHDPKLQAMWKSLRKNYYNMKLSKNPLIRELFRKKQELAQIKRAQTQRLRSARRALSGSKKANVLRDKWRQRFCISHWVFDISLKMASISHKTEIKVFCSLSLDGERHPQPYVTNSQTGSTAARLGIHIEGLDEHGRPFKGWLHNSGAIPAIARASTFVDFLEGKDIQNPGDRPMRWIPSAYASKKKASYTPDAVRLIEQEKQEKHEEESNGEKKRKRAEKSSNDGESRTTRQQKKQNKGTQ